MLLNKKTLFNFYYKFYCSLVLKDKDINIQIGEKQLDYKNTILFSFLDFTEILNNLNFKKGTIFYDYLTSFINEIDIVDNNRVFENLLIIVKNLIEKTNMDIDFTVDEDIEKLLYNCITFKNNFNIHDIDNIYNKLLNKIISNNINKLFIIFYDSSLLNLNLNNFDNCYSFDISLNLNNYNLICDEEIKYFNINYILEELESLWPIEFNKIKVKNYINKYLTFKKINACLVSYEETEYLVYTLLNKIYNYSLPIQNFCPINDNIKSFLTNL